MTDQERADYAQAVWREYSRVTRRPLWIMSCLEWEAVRGWMVDGIPLRVVLSAISEASGRGRSLTYYERPVRDAYQRWRQALQVAQ